MCHFLYLASPLTLSEIRSMLPPGLAADLLPPAEARLLRQAFPSAQTTARILAGTCSCDLFVQRDPNRGEETELRRRYRALGLSRPDVIRALEHHRRGTRQPATGPSHWAHVLSTLVAEHARNAGRSLWFRHVSPAGLTAAPEEIPDEISVAQVLAAPAGWLADDRPVVVRPN